MHPWRPTDRQPAPPHFQGETHADEPADPARQPPRGRSHGQQLQAGLLRDATAGRWPGAGAPPLHEPGPVHARPHERRQELRGAAAAGAGDARRHGRRGGGKPAPQVRGRRQGRRLRRLAAVQRGRRHPTRHAAQGRHRAGAVVALPGSGRHARRDRLVRPGQDHRAQGWRDAGRERRQRRGGQRLWCAGQGTRLPRGGRGRWARQVRLRQGRTGLRRLHRLPPARRRQEPGRGAESRLPRRHRWPFRERRRPGVRRRAAAGQRVRAGGTVRHDRRLRRRAAATGQPVADPDQTA